MGEDPTLRPIYCDKTLTVRGFIGPLRDVPKVNDVIARLMDLAGAVFWFDCLGFKIAQVGRHDAADTGRGQSAKHLISGIGKRTPTGHLV